MANIDIGAAEISRSGDFHHALIDFRVAGESAGSANFHGAVLFDHQFAGARYHTAKREDLLIRPVN